jgi:hypothetical protein
MNDFDFLAKKRQAKKFQKDKDDCDCHAKKPQDNMNDLILLRRNRKMT